MNKTRLLPAAALLFVASAPLLTSWMPLSTVSPTPTAVYPGNHAFVHETGLRSPYGWEAFYRQHRPGYLAKGLHSGGDRLPRGTYQYDFYFALRSGHLASLLSGANDVIRVEVADTTTGEVLEDRAFQLCDFPRGHSPLFRKSLRFTTWNRADHLFEPRVYWQGLAGVFLQRVELTAIGDPALSTLQEKAGRLGALLDTQFLDRGFLVVRDDMKRAQDLADAAIWTGLYVATEARRYNVTRDRDALKQVERSLWALDSLVRAAPAKGTMVRYVDATGRVLEQAPSKDTYTGFFYGVAQGLPIVRNAALRQALVQDLESLATHFLDHDLTFISGDGATLDLNPYPGNGFLTELMEDLRDDPGFRHDVSKGLKLARWYFWLHGQSSPPTFSTVLRDLQKPDVDQLSRDLLPFLNDLRGAMKLLQRNVHRSALRGSREGLSGTPYMKLDLLLLNTLHGLDENTGGQALSTIADFKILPSQSLHALHFLKVAGALLPKPNRYEYYYRANLFHGKALLRTAAQWHQIDEDALIAVLGQTEADTRRTASSHVSYLALHDLIELETDPSIRFQYQKLFEAQYRPMRQDGNAMIDTMQASVGLSPEQLGLALWSLERYPEDRRGKGDRYWMENRKQVLADFEGEVNGQAREPLPPDLRPRDAFLWQRSAHSIRGDKEGWLYPPLDYLFAYWLARTAHPPTPKDQ